MAICLHCAINGTITRIIEVEGYTYIQIDIKFKVYINMLYMSNFKSIKYVRTCVHFKFEITATIQEILLSIIQKVLFTLILWEENIDFYFENIIYATNYKTFLIGDW